MEHIFSWAKRAKCTNESVLQEQLTKKYCTDCPVIGLCSTYAIVHDELGIWGGTGDVDRRRLHTWFPEFVDLLIEIYRQENLLENRSSDLLNDPLESLMQLVEQQQEHIDPISLPETYGDSTLSQSA
jgi:hypothetical protein